MNTTVLKNSHVVSTRNIFMKLVGALIQMLKMFLVDTTCEFLVCSIFFYEISRGSNTIIITRQDPRSSDLLSNICSPLWLWSLGWWHYIVRSRFQSPSHAFLHHLIHIYNIYMYIVYNLFLNLYFYLSIVPNFYFPNVTFEILCTFTTCVLGQSQCNTNMYGMPTLFAMLCIAPFIFLKLILKAWIRYDVL